MCFGHMLSIDLLLCLDGFSLLGFRVRVDSLDVVLVVEVGEETSEDTGLENHE